MIRILVPTRARPAMLADMAQSCLDRAHGKVTVLAGIDRDDLYRGTYVHTPRRRWDLHEFPSGGGVCRIWNELALMHTQPDDILMLGNDDLLFETDGWDEAVLEAFQKWPDHIGTVFCNDGINEGRHAAFPFVHRRWVDVVGYLSGATKERGFHFWYNDTWIFDVAKKIGRVQYLPNVSIRHKHFTVTGNADETTKRNRNDNQGAKDRVAWDASESHRITDANKLKEVMS